ncbi:carbohydrate kinase family protein [Pontibacter chitinilyticus]|uniref:carbohydrate kinase family protein n=1 Tax=Pontibacter chitinilyticus TaxID=2674989 RepID=UPI00321BCDB9
MNKIVCFGEMLWDMLPTGRLAGGAPMNVAIHLQYLGNAPAIISRVGQDALGKELRTYLHCKGVADGLVQQDEAYKTGVVEVNVRNRSEVTYTIVQPVAWDFIALTAEAQQVTTASDLFIYGSLAARSQTSRHTLLALLELAKYKVFDVNLRPPHYDRALLEQLLPQADMLKLNHHELAEIACWHQAYRDEKSNMQLLQEQYKLDKLLVTRGEHGAALLTTDGFYEQPGYAVTVEDTIGSGDAFLAAFLSSYLAGEAYQQSLQKACARGALVATHRGATPEISCEAIAALVQQGT